MEHFAIDLGDRVEQALLLRMVIPFTFDGELFPHGGVIVLLSDRRVATSHVRAFDIFWELFPQAPVVAEKGRR